MKNLDLSIDLPGQRKDLKASRDKERDKRQV